MPAHCFGLIFGCNVFDNHSAGRERLRRRGGEVVVEQPVHPVRRHVADVATFGVVAVRLASLPARRKAVPVAATVDRATLLDLRQLLETRKIMPVVDRQYPLSDVAAALRYLGEGHAPGKVIITV